MNLTKLVTSLALFLIATSAFGQDAKPTMAQTIEYIQSNYPRSIVYAARGKSSPFSYRGEISDLAFGVSGSRVTVEYLDVLKSSLFESGVMTEEETKRERHLITFDLKDIEAIEGFSYPTIGYVPYYDAELGAYVVYLVFRAAGGKPAISTTMNGESKQVSDASVPFTLDGVSDNHLVMKEFKNSQLYKALEHLRKLSGAPEPLRF